MTPTEKAEEMMVRFNDPLSASLAAQEVINSDPHGVEWWVEVQNILINNHKTKTTKSWK